MKIFLCRHGETTGDVEDRYGGDYEDHLTEKGRDQAKKLAHKLQSRGVEKIITSPRIRARETSEIINNVLNVGIEILDEIRERNHYGILSGMTKSEAREKYPQEAEAVKSFMTEAIGGESYADFCQRIEEGISKIRKNDGSIICIVTHGGVIRYFFREKLNMGEVHLEDSAWAELDFGGNQLKLIDSQGVKKK